MSNYATETDLKIATGVDTSKFAKNVDLAKLKSDVDKLDIDKLGNVPSNLNNLKSKIDKLVPVSVDLNKVSDAVKMMPLKKAYIILVHKHLPLRTKLLMFLLMLK